MFKTILQTLLLITLLALAYNFVNTLQVDYYYNVINRDTSLLKASAFMIISSLLIYISYK